MRNTARQLEAQGYKCAYPCAGDGRGAELKPGDELALAYDNNGLIHLACAKVGAVPEPAEREQ